jgi:selenocysteine lyase/cysteine desulfurase
VDPAVSVPAYTRVYCDNASTSYPKAPGVAEAMAFFLASSPASHSRRGHSAADTGQALLETVRANLLSVVDAPLGSSAILTLNATDAINLALRGYLSPGAHVLTSGFEHSAVTRTLTALARDSAVTVEVLETRPGQRLHAADVAASIRPETALVVLALNNNVTGDRVPGEDLGPWLRRRGITYMLDAAQSVAAVPASMAELEADIFAFSGHKSLLGPPGVGCLVVAAAVPLRVVRTGGTGRRADSDAPDPREARDYETGTQNTVGVAGLKAALDYLQDHGLAEAMKSKRVLAERFADAVRAMPGVFMHGALRTERGLAADHLPTVCLTVPQVPAAEVGAALEEGFGVVTRTGLHCSPWTHRRLGTAPDGAVRFSFGVFQTADDVDHAAGALREIVRSRAFWARR